MRVCAIRIDAKAARDSQEPASAHLAEQHPGQGPRFGSLAPGIRDPFLEGDFDGADQHERCGCGDDCNGRDQADKDPDKPFRPTGNRPGEYGRQFDDRRDQRMQKMGLRHQFGTGGNGQAVGQMQRPHGQPAEPNLEVVMLGNELQGLCIILSDQPNDHFQQGKQGESRRNGGAQTFRGVRAGGQTAGVLRASGRQGWRAWGHNKRINLELRRDE